MYKDSSFSTLFTGELAKYWENGHLEQKAHYVNGFKEGVCTYYYPNTKQVESTITYVHGKRHGEQMSYYKNGQLHYKEYWENGQRSESTSYDENGKQLSKTVWHNGKLISEERTDQAK